MARHSPARRVRRVLAAISLLLAGLAGPTAAGEAPEYAVKAAFLYNFAKFTTWPAQTFDDPGAAMRFCVLGEAPFGRSLDALGGKQVRGRPVAVDRVEAAGEAKNCQVLFVSDDRAAELAEILEGVGDRPVLTVGETAGFSQRGGIINFVTQGGKVRFEINPGAAERGGVQLSAQLLRLATVVTGERRDR